MAAAIKKSAALLALTQAAIAVPSVAAGEGIEAGYLFSEYREQDIAGSRTATGRDESRYDIQSHLFKIVAPLESSVVNVDLTYETMSGASPWYVTPDADGKPVQVMSGASINEERVDLQAQWSKPIKNVLVGLTGGYSTEDDYEAINGGVELEFENPSKTLTWRGGLGYSSDKLDPTDADQQRRSRLVDDVWRRIAGGQSNDGGASQRQLLRLGWIPQRPIQAGVDPEHLQCRRR